MTMLIYLIRHGNALSASEDCARPLSARGREEVATTARALVRMEVDVGAIITSSKLRAQQTGQIVADALGFPAAEIVSTADADPDVPPTVLARYLLPYAKQSAVLVAGHLPSLPALATYLLANTERSFLAFETATVCCLQADGLAPESAELLWQFGPDEAALMAD